MYNLLELIVGVPMCDCNKDKPVSNKKPHVHAEVIKAWADGAEVQYLDNTKSALRVSAGTWVDTDTPEWLEYCQYRIKPELTDVEKYGVEKGDAWRTGEFGLVFVTDLTPNGWYRTNKGYELSCVSMKELLFRRGVVDKL
jgi:hypothetical protein